MCISVRLRCSCLVEGLGYELPTGWVVNELFKLFFLGRGSPYFKRSSVEFLAEFKELEYFFLKSMYLLG